MLSIVYEFAGLLIIEKPSATEKFPEHDRPVPASSHERTLVLCNDTNNLPAGCTAATAAKRQINQIFKLKNSWTQLIWYLLSRMICIFSEYYAKKSRVGGSKKSELSHHPGLNSF